MQYICHKRFKDKVLCGKVNLPAMTQCEEVSGVIFHKGNPICAIASENAHQYFTRNDDGQGLLRGKLTQAIQTTLRKRDKDHQARWDKVWADSICQKYKRTEHADYWLWNHEFYNADIYDLQHIAKLVGAKI